MVARLVAQYASEAAMCAAFIEALPESWTAYPETGGFDILLVHRTGVQIGIEAKLSLNAKVVLQAAPETYPYAAMRPGPDFRAVLVPGGRDSGDLASLCKYLGIMVLAVHNEVSMRFDDWQKKYVDKQYWIRPLLPQFGPHESEPAGWDFCPPRRIKLPEHIPDVEAGLPAPVRLTAWKIKAIKLSITLQRRGFLVSNDFRHFSISPSRWTQPPGYAWLDKGKKRGVWVASDRLPDFRAQHPTNYASIEETYDRWKAADPLEPVGIPDLFEEGESK